MLNEPAIRRFVCCTVLAIVLGTIGVEPCAGDVSPSKLTAENLLLIVNRNEPAGRRLADYYINQRKVPDGRILALDLPKGDEISALQFQTEVVPAVRAFLRDNKLEEQVTCLVTFFGVPLRVGQRVNLPEESAEYRSVDQQYKASLAAALQAVVTAEEVATEAQSDFKRASEGQEFPAMAMRADAAVRSAIETLATDGNAERRSQRFSRLMTAVEKLYGPLETQERLALPAYQKLAPKPVTEEEQTTRRAATQKLITEIQTLNPQAVNSADARAKLRDLFLTHLGQLRSIQVLTDHRVRLETSETQAAFDSELACLWWPDTMLRYRWLDNPLNYKVRYGGVTSRPTARVPRTLMVARLDAPTEQIVHDMIETSVKVESEGLKGIAALDARGKSPSDAYGKYDEKLREAAAELKTKSRTTVRIENTEPVFPPQSVDNVALYCGWYSLRNYVPGMKFNPGAVAYHVASGEMISLHAAGEKGWCANLLKSGVVATLGPVAEPYLHSFPLPTEFFPLLMTGKLKLAEVYWLTNPLVSWMNALVGDPLYTPYAREPSMKDVDVSYQLRAIFASSPVPAPNP